MSEDHGINIPPFGTEPQPIDFVGLAETYAEALAGRFPYLARTLRRCQVAAGTRKRLQEDFHTSRASPESKVA
jgi:hypothetical protein